MHGPTIFTLWAVFVWFLGSLLIVRVTIWRRWSIPRQRYIRDCEVYDVGRWCISGRQKQELWTGVVSSSIAEVVYGRRVVGRRAEAEIHVCVCVCVSERRDVYIFR
jgi:hypothetical protein